MEQRQIGIIGKALFRARHWVSMDRKMPEGVSYTANQLIDEINAAIDELPETVQSTIDRALTKQEDDERRETYKQMGI